MNFTNCWAKDVLYDASVGKVYVRCWRTRTKCVRLELTHILTRDISGNWNGDGRIPRIVLQYTASGHGYQCCSHINVRFSLLIAVIDRFVDTFAWRRSYCRRYAFDFAVDCVFSAITFTPMLSVLPNAGTIRRFYGQINVFEHGYPSAGSFKPEYHDSTYQTELFGVKRGMDLDEDETFAELTEVSNALPLQRKSTKLLQDTTEE